MKIVFITPSASIRKTFFYRVGNRLYTRPSVITGPLILATILKRQGYDACVYEELFSNIDPFKAARDADIVCLSAMSSTADRTYELADRFRAEGKRVVIGGIHPSGVPEEAILHADTVVVGEGERAILDIVEKGLNGIIHGETPANLDTIPFPDYSLLKTPVKTANILTTRGCHFRCDFCSTSRMFMPYRERSPENVIEELRYYKKLGFKYVSFQDDNFTGNRERAKEILARVVKENLVFRSGFFFGRADLARDEELLDLLNRAHFNSVLIGFESLNKTARDSINKKLDLDSLREYLPNLEKHHIRVIASFVLGLDADTKEDFKNDVEFAHSIHAYKYQPAVLTPFPGTLTTATLQKENRILIKDWQYYDMMHAVFRPALMSPQELQQEFYRSVTKFYSFRSAVDTFKHYGPLWGTGKLMLWITLSFIRLISPLIDRQYFKKLKAVEHRIDPEARLSGYNR
jgi:radical SAM superfamily enzyme YgiQ (UPF0313 family)